LKSWKKYKKFKFQDRADNNHIGPRKVFVKGLSTSLKGA